MAFMAVRPEHAKARVEVKRCNVGDVKRPVKLASRPEDVKAAHDRLVAKGCSR